jgi:Icc-related predicted phosphoesterase
MIIHSGDISNSSVLGISINECMNFLDWYESLNYKYKILIAGNHDTAFYKAGKVFRQACKERNIIYLENSEVEIEGIKIFGSPITPTFNDWSFMKDRSKLYKFWENCLPEKVDILVTHGPPQGILDLSINRANQFEYCGDKSLRTHVIKIKPKYHLFGHIHSYKNEIVNNGFRTIPYIDTVFSNAACVMDGDFKITYHGNIINYEN